MYVYTHAHWLGRLQFFIKIIESYRENILIKKLK